MQRLSFVYKGDGRQATAVVLPGKDIELKKILRCSVFLCPDSEYVPLAEQPRPHRMDLDSDADGFVRDGELMDAVSCCLMACELPEADALLYVTEISPPTLWYGGILICYTLYNF